MILAVLGARGFIGSAVLRAATRRSVPACGLDRPHEREADERIRASLQAIADSRADVVIHAATEPARPDLGDRIAEEVALQGALARRNLRTVIIGSAAVLGDGSGAGEDGLAEDYPPAPVNEYGRFKLAQEESATGLRARGWNVTVVRLFNPIGPGIGRHLMLGRLVEEIARRRREPRLDRTIVMGDLSAIRDFMHVDDVADGILTLLERPNLPAIIHFGTGVGLPVRKVVRLALELAGLANLRVTEAGESSSRSREVPSAVADPTLLWSLTPWRPTRSLDEAVVATLRGSAAVERQSSFPTG